MSTPRLFEPFDVGALHLAHRIVIAPMGQGLRPVANGASCPGAVPY
jgi:2,4-dienoyl-CoA reductase-like NADH-dependent reductase (Old Yellow Enzyme family)